MPKRKTTSTYKVKRKRSKWASAGNGIPPAPRTLDAKTANRNITSISQTVLTQVVLSSATNYFGAFTFALSDISNYTEYQTVFDEYRIVAVKMTACTGVVVNTNTYNGSSIVGTQVPQLITAIDTDDAATPNLNTILSHDTCKIHGVANKTFTRWLQPEVALAAYQGTFVGYAAKSKQWIQTVSSGVQHYGLKYAIVDVQAQNSQNYNFYMTYYFEFRKAI